MAKQKTKDRLHRLELLVVVSLALIVGGVFLINQTDFSSFFDSNNLVTGFVSSDVITENLDLLIEQSQDYNLDTIDSFRLTSLRLTGSVEGEGVVKIFLEDSIGGRSLVYTNVREKKNGNLITGMVVADPKAVSIGLNPGEIKTPISEAVGENEEIIGEVFYNECMDTCFMSIDFSPENSNKLVFQLSQGTKLRINKLSYTTG